MGKNSGKNEIKETKFLKYAIDTHTSKHTTFLLLPEEDLEKFSAIKLLKVVLLSFYKLCVCETTILLT